MANKLANYKANLKDNFTVLYKKFSAAPTGLKAFAIFALVVTILQMSIFFLAKQEIRSFYSEKFGVITGVCYMNTLFFVFALIFTTRPRKNNVLRFAIAAQLIFTIGLHCFKLLHIIEGGKFEKSGNVGLIWSIIIPAIWVIVIFSPTVGKFCRKIILQNK